MLGDYILDPFFIDGNLNAVKYIQLQQNQIIPKVHLLSNNFDFNKSVFLETMHDQLHYFS